MRVAFDISPLTRAYPPGVTRATRGLYETLRNSTSIEIVPVAPQQDESERFWRHQSLPRTLIDLDCVGLHSPVSSFPHLGPGKRLQTLHELPWRHGVSENSGLSHRFWARFGPWRADAVICPTEFVRRDLVAESPHGHQRIHVAPWGIDTTFTPTIDCQSREELLEQLRLPSEPFLLALGAVRRKKNLAASLRALAHGESDELQDLHLVVTGEDSEDLRADLRLATELGIRQRVHTLGQITDSDIPRLINSASAVMILSHSEGFGFPALEAMASGTPVVLTRNSAPAEIAGPSGYQVNPEDPVEVADAVGRALSARSSDREIARKRAAQFSWERCASKVEEIWMSWAD